MLPELGYFCLLLAVAFSALLCLAPTAGLWLRQPALMRPARALACIICLLLGTALVVLALCFVLNDFSVEYVAQHSNTRLPLFYKIAAVWGGHEGSMLFFVFSLSLWSALVALLPGGADEVTLARVLAVLGALLTAFCLFLLLTSSPFVRLFPAAFEGRDLNPMLQDVALIFHPPLLYLGYVGFAVSFAWAMAALASGRTDSAIIHWSRPWTLAAWAFLTLGIALGSWWAYYELGWGGWWFWDPVENASLLPWLTGTALLHALVACEKRGIYGYAVLLLSILTFSLSLLGTFVVRSGVLSSVHAFALDPGRGTALLLVLGAMLAIALGLFALRADTRTATARYSLLSKEVFLGLASALPAVAAACVFLGTMYPLFYKLLAGGALSVGAPYFNRVFVPLCLLVMLALPFAPRLRWKRLPANWWRAQIAPFLAGVAAGAWLCLRHDTPGSATALVACVLGGWVLFSHALALLRSRFGRQSGVHLAHIGVALAVIGAAQVSQYTTERRVAMLPGQPFEVGAHVFVIDSVEPVIGPNFTAEQINISVRNARGRTIASVAPQRRHYTVRAMGMNEVGLRWGWLGDFYVVPGDRLPDGEWIMHLQYRPMVRWIWIGALLMAAGAALLLMRWQPVPPRAAPAPSPSQEARP